MRRLFLACLLLLAPAALAAGPETLPEGPKGVVTQVIDGDTIRIEDVDADIRIVGIQSPKLPLGRKGFQAWPLAEEARAAVVKLVEGRAIILRLATTPRDRNNRILAHVMRDDGLWLQAELLRLGWARVYTFADNRELAAELYTAEREARAAKRGIWAHPFYAVRPVDPAALKGDMGMFQVVEGVITDAAKVRGRVYLNFGADFRTDFTASIPPEVAPMFTKAQVDPLSFKGKKVRVRGYVRDFNGPAIDLTHPEQLELVE